MRLALPLKRLPLRFDPAQLAAELARFEEAQWIKSPRDALGSSAIPLVTVGGTASQDFALAGPVRPTRALLEAPYLLEVLGSLGVPVSRSRLVRLPGMTMAPVEKAWNYHWFRRVPLLIPLVTGPEVTFGCGGTTAHLPAAEVFVFDNSQNHQLHNPTAASCVHLIVETTQPEAVGTGSGSLRLEPYEFTVLSPDEIRELTAQILAAAEPPAGVERGVTGPLTDQPMGPSLGSSVGSSIGPAIGSSIAPLIEKLRQGWQAAFAQFGHRSAGELAYQDLILDLREKILPKLSPGSAGHRAAVVIDTMLEVTPKAPLQLRRPVAAPQQTDPAPLGCPQFERPLFIVSAPRAGSTLLFDLISRFPEVFTIGTESHELIRGIPELHPAARDYQSDRLAAAAASPAIIEALRLRFAQRLRNRRGQSYSELPTPMRPAALRFVEKTPANALRIPFLRAVFPDAQFVYLSREPRENISSLVEGWRSRRFLAYRGMPGWPYRDWSFLLPPGWANLAGRSLVEIAAYQWQTANATIEQDLRELPDSAWCKVSYEDLIRHPRQVLLTIAERAGLRWDAELEQAVAGALPVSRVTLSAPAPDKWRRHQEELAALLPGLTANPDPLNP